MLIKNVHVQSLWGHVNKYLTVSIEVSVYTENEEVFIIHNYYRVFMNGLSHISHWKPLDNLFLLLTEPNIWLNIFVLEQTTESWGY